MSVFTVYLPGGTKDKEFQTYAELLNEKGIDINKVARVPETGTQRQLLHTWSSQSDAEDFADELRRRTGIREWIVQEIEDGRTGTSRLPPVTIERSRTGGEILYRLEDKERRRIKNAFPLVNVLPKISISSANEDSLRWSVSDPLEQIIILLTGLNADQLVQIGGVQIVDQASGEVLWSQADHPLSLSTQDYNTLMECWIGEHTSDAANLEDVLQYLTSYTISRGVPHPPAFGYEEWLWPWNQAGGRFLDHGQPLAAAGIWSGCYLSLLSLQEHYHFRIHKGMPLCNLGLAFLKANDRDSAIMSWFLGLVEDTITNPGTCMEAQNFKNLLTVEVNRDLVRSFALAIQARFADPSVIVSVPELCVQFGFAPQLGSFDPKLLTAVASFINDLSLAFPMIPRASLTADRLRQLWSAVPFSQRRLEHE